MSRSHGFLEEAAKEIRTRPGQSANEIAKRLLADGRATSTARDPVASLVATLHKHHAAKSVRRERRAGQYRYFPGSDPESGETSASSQPLRVSHSCDGLIADLPQDYIRFIDALLVLPQFTSRRDVILWLIRKGMESAQVS